jgi:rfaE bifunctional protein nucleotidyltransferase chain/domain
VFTNGCFDLLHKGHVEYLAKAADHGDILVVGMNSDDSVKRIKGDSRPVQDESSRTMTLASLKMVTLVVVFEEDTPYNLIKDIKPDVLVKGADYNEDDIVGSDIVKENGGEIVTVDLTEGYSTSNIIAKIKN